jgi:Plasmid pRiA4b ORF-3-like protein
MEEGDRLFDYVWDYGYNGCCAIVIEALVPAIPGMVYPRLVEGARRGPPEDIVGAWSYAEFLEAIADPKHEQNGAAETSTPKAFPSTTSTPPSRNSLSRRERDQKSHLPPLRISQP